MRHLRRMSTSTTENGLVMHRRRLVSHLLFCSCCLILAQQVLPSLVFSRTLSNWVAWTLGLDQEARRVSFLGEDGNPLPATSSRLLVHFGTVFSSLVSTICLLCTGVDRVFIVGT